MRTLRVKSLLDSSWVDLALFDFSQYLHVVSSFCDECAQYIRSIKSSDDNLL